MGIITTTAKSVITVYLYYAANEIDSIFILREIRITINCRSYSRAGAKKKAQKILQQSLR